MRLTLVFLALIVGLMACKKPETEDLLFTGDEYENIMQYIEANPEYSYFKRIALAGNMVDALSSYNSNGGNGYTLFLPTNEAVMLFINSNERYTSLDALLQDTEYAAEIVRYHLVNGRIPTSDFPNGALGNRTISNYFLTIVFKDGDRGVTFSVNNEAQVVSRDIEKDNGIIHTIDKMLTPVFFTSYDWISQSTKFTIFAELLQRCGLEDTLNYFEIDELEREIYSEYTIFAESDSLYEANGINSFTDLVNLISPSGDDNQDFTNPSNAVNKYARYHIINASVFLDEFATEVYNTYGDFPISVDLDGILKINKNTMVFDTIITNASDTLLVDYLQIITEQSNITTRNGAIHQLDHLLFPFLPGKKTVTIQFYDEPIINALRNIEGGFVIFDEDLEKISLIGTRFIQYVKSASDIPRNSNNDYIKYSGDIDFYYQTPKILAGRYELVLVIERGDRNKASIQVSVDEKKVGVVIDAKETIGNQSPGFNTSGGDNAVIGIVEFSEYSSHIVKLSTIIPGDVLIDRIIFRPIN